MQSTSPQVIFLSETRNSSISVSSLVNHFNLNGAFVVPSQGQSGGLWLMWTDEIELHIFDHSQNYILAFCKNNSTNISYGLICMYGDPRHLTKSIIWNHVLHFVSQNSNLPMLCMGDLNDIMHPSEKLGPSTVDIDRINAFCSYVKHCGLFDLGFNGPSYTWSNKRFSSAPTYERLDRCLANAEWCRLFPTSSVLHLPMMYSDHAPILLLPTSNRQRPKNPFDLKTGGFWKKTFRMLLKPAGTDPLLDLSLTKLVFWLHILNIGADSNPKLEISSTPSRNKF
jgi:exonuclease III